MKEYLKRKTWVRNVYSNRGLLGVRDLITESLVARACIICGKTLERKTTLSGKSEQWQNFLQRKTCGFYFDEFGGLHKSKCSKELFKGKGNPNYKGIMPKCLDCGKMPKGYSSITGAIPKRCLRCFKKWARKTHYFETRPQALLIAERMRKKGIQPKHEIVNTY